MVFLESQWEAWVCSHITEEEDIKNFCFSATSGLLSSYDGQLRNLNQAGQDNTDASGGEAGDQGSLSSWNSDIGINIHFQKESGIVSF